MTYHFGSNVTRLLYAILGLCGPPRHEPFAGMDPAVGSLTLPLGYPLVWRQGIGNPHHSRQQGRLGEGCLR